MQDGIDPQDGDGAEARREPIEAEHALTTTGPPELPAIRESRGERGTNIWTSLPAILQIGAILAKSGYFADARDENRAVAKIIFGAEFGLGPATALQNIDNIEGHLTLKPQLMAALVQQSDRFSYRIKDMTAERCAIAFYERGEVLGVEEFTIDDAKRAGLAGKSNWLRYPKAMLWARAMSSGCRHFCPAILQGAAYTSEELGGERDSDVPNLGAFDIRIEPEPIEDTSSWPSLDDGNL